MIPFFVLLLLHNHDFHLLNTKHRQLPYLYSRGVEPTPEKDDATAQVFVRYLPAFSSIDFSDEKV